MAPPADKVCATCGRTFEWRKKWERCWDEVRYCSDRCRRHRPGAIDEQLEQAILELLRERKGGATICPSEVPRRVAPDDWRPLMEPTRAAARRLAASGRVEFLQKGKRVDPSHVRGPFRLRKL